MISSESVGPSGTRLLQHLLRGVDSGASAAEGSLQSRQIVRRAASNFEHPCLLGPTSPCEQRPENAQMNAPVSGVLGGHGVVVEHDRRLNSGSGAGDRPATA